MYCRRPTILVFRGKYSAGANNGLAAIPQHLYRKDRFFKNVPEATIEHTQTRILGPRIAKANSLGLACEECNGGMGAIQERILLGERGVKERGRQPRHLTFKLGEALTAEEEIER